MRGLHRLAQSVLAHIFPDKAAPSIRAHPGGWRPYVSANPERFPRSPDTSGHPVHQINCSKVSEILHQTRRSIQARAAAKFYSAYISAPGLTSLPPASRASPAHCASMLQSAGQAKLKSREGV